MVERRDTEAGLMERGTHPTFVQPWDDRMSTPASAVPAPVGPAWVPEFMERYPLQKIAIDMVDFAEELHRCLPVAGDAGTPGTEGLRLRLIQLEVRLTRLLARSGIERDEPTGSAVDPHGHQEVVQVLSSAWTLNGRLLRPAMVAVPAAQPDMRSAGTAMVIPFVSREG